MNPHRNLLITLGEWWEVRRLQRTEKAASPSPVSTVRSSWFPTPGNIIFTLLVMVGLLWAQSAGALSLGAPLAASTSTGTLAYQGRLANSSGQPLTQTVNMIFRLYAAVSGGTPLWEEQWTGSNSVQVSDGLFNVMLGSLTPIPPAVITGNANLFLGIAVGTDSEMNPRVQLGSVPFATQALTVPDGSITKAKLASNLIQAATVTSGNWDVPQCKGSHFNNSTEWQKIPSAELSINLDQPRTVFIDFAGLGINSGANEAIYSNVFIDGVRTTVANNESLLGGCRNDTSDTSGSWCSLANSTAVSLNAGAHVIDVRIWCDGVDSNAIVQSGSLRALVLP